MAREGWTGIQAAFAVDRQKARRERRADIETSGSEYDPELEAAAGAVHGRPVRAMEWSARLGAFVWWRFDPARAKWMPEGVEAAVARRLRVELSDANEGRSIEEVLSDRLVEGAV